MVILVDEFFIEYGFVFSFGIWRLAWYIQRSSKFSLCPKKWRILDPQSSSLLSAVKKAKDLGVENDSDVQSGET